MAPPRPGFPSPGGPSPGSPGGFRQCRVTVVSASGLPRRSGGDVTDPYVTVTVGEGSQRTRTIQNAGSDASFNETLTFPYRPEFFLTVSVYDENRGRDELLGTGTMPLEANIRGHRGPVPIMNKGRPNGEVQVQIQGC
eukprot:Protomagalhaensia_wolfi_Nauph_80__6032@NODE_831_length_1966_cov_5835_702128_g508_i1_p2_GENE_NODE_831_length_1966_cov_5835_702128_g508_i1NODE_831_length_1966_cov_5835_702128_g508_i1_p2_ORF_typecomplete_len138_score30_63C2/PF00168_30/1e18_NODE_831_length_1966_cov_5835_702128_g508_i18301243